MRLASCYAKLPSSLMLGIIFCVNNIDVGLFDGASYVFLPVVYVCVISGKPTSLWRLGVVTPMSLYFGILEIYSGGGTASNSTNEMFVLP